MSFLKSASDVGGITGLGSSLGLSPTGLQGLGTAFNGIASAGGASPGYGGAQVDPGRAEVPKNHLQLLNNDILNEIIRRIGGGNGTPPRVGGAYQ